MVNVYNSSNKSENEMQMILSAKIGNRFMIAIYVPHTYLADGVNWEVQYSISSEAHLFNPCWGPFSIIVRNAEICFTCRTFDWGRRMLDVKGMRKVDFRWVVAE